MRFLLNISILFSAIFLTIEATANPTNMTFQGRLYDSSGHPLDAGSATVVTQIRSHDGSCLLYEETRGVSMENSDGYFSVLLGLGTKTSISPNFLLSEVLSNSTSFSDPLLDCAGNSYTPGTQDARILRAYINGEKLEPDLIINSSPYSLYANHAMQLGGKTLAQVEDHANKHLAGFPLPDLSASPLSSGDSFQWDGSKWVTFQPAPADLPPNSVTIDDLDFASNNGINIPQLASDPSAPTAGQTYYNTTTNKLMVYNGSTWVETGSSTGPWNVSAGDVTYSGGNVGVGTATPNASALLEISSTTKGFLPPRMTTAERDSVSSPAEGLTIFNTTTDKLNIYAGGAWTEAGAGTSGASGFVGALEYTASANCVWTSNSGSYTNFSADSDCGMPSLAGMASPPNTAKTPAIKFVSLPAGRYRVIATGLFYTSSSGSACEWAISDGANRKGYAYTANLEARTANHLIADFSYGSSQTDIHFAIQSIRISGSGNCSIYSDDGEKTLNFSVTRIDGNGKAIELADDDGNTKIQVEKNADENIIRFDTTGIERMTIDAIGDVDIVGKLTAGTLVGDASGVTNIGAAAITDGSITVADVDFASTDGLNIPQLATAPSGTAGQMYYNTSDNKLYVHNGTTFVEVGSGGSSAGVDYDSGWQAVSDGNNYQFTHNLGTQLLEVTVLYKDASGNISHLHDYAEEEGQESGYNLTYSDANTIDVGINNNYVFSTDNTLTYGVTKVHHASGDIRIFLRKLLPSGSTIYGDGHSLDSADSLTTDVVYINNSGNVGVGTTTPGSLLDVAGTIRATELCDESGANCSDLSAGLGGGGAGPIAAWVTFDGTNGSIISSSNVSSVTRTAAGTYIVNFSSVFSDTSYAVFGAHSFSGSAIGALAVEGKSTSSVDVAVEDVDGPRTDYPEVYVSILSGSAGVNGNLWQESGSNIYKAAGNVGIGTSPTMPLDVNGAIRIAGTGSEPCTATEEGSQRYNSTSKKMEFCNGTAWSEFGSDSSSSCGKRHVRCYGGSAFYDSGGSTNHICLGSTLTASCSGPTLTSVSCPTGYTYSSLHIGSAGGGNQYHISCIKN